ncbi:uncharacterized protein LOC112593910 isoform X3 [Melanaphis sacchari]|uniref:uncharacterized protein LOC112593910 isoform X3 n=1 Tax=Melanaphis sacchari TaxID=742174 RepID=UPI000DC1481A|nr:uncharacterized protein LOC112593910 isoform X3 [Melanaphis sacchari]
MDLNSLKDPHNSRCNISPLNDNSNTSGTNVTKLNESTLVKLEQKEIKHFEIDDDDDDDDDCVVLSEQQVPVKQMIATTSVVNVPKLIKINKHPHYIKSSSDISNNTSGTKVTKFNESISTKLQAQDTGNVKIRDKHDVEISKRQRPVNQIMETTSVINENNLHKISSSLDNSNSRTDKEIIKLNESTSTKVQERKKTEHFKVGDKNVVETFNQQVPIKHTIPTASVIKSPTINVKDINFRKSHMELSNLVKINNKKRNIEVAKLNKSTSTKVYEQKTPVNLRILDNFSNYEKSKLIPYEKVIKTSFVINTPKKIPNKIFVKPNNFSLNLEKIAVPKTVMSNVKTLPSFMSSQIKKPSTISIPSTTHINPKKPIITRLQPKLNPVNITNNKCVSTSKPGFKIISSNDLKSKMVLFPQNKGNFTTKEPNTVRLVHFNSINQSKTKLNANVHGDGKHVLVQFLKNNNSNSNSTIAKVPTDKMLKIIPNKVHVPQYQKINTATNEKNMIYPHVSFLEPWKRSSKSNTHAKTSRMTKSVPVKMIMPKISQTGVSGPFNQCEYEYCDTIAYKPEMIDYKYCSLVCKSLNTKLMIATQKPKPIAAAQPQENTDLSKKPVIDRKMLLAKLRSRINKRKQSLPSFQKENVSGHDLDQVEQLNKMALKMPPPAIPITVNHSLPYKRKFFNLNEASAVVQNCKQETAKIFSYLQHTDYIPAPRKLFDNPFPHDSNPFKIGQRLEGIDPEHEALFCVMTVVEVCGYRIKLNFDGYSDIYNFWVNADCPDLFFPRWCEQNSRTLQPPKNYNQPFKWTDYLKIPGVMPAPKWNFPNALNTNRITNHSFRIRAKLEALDKLTRTTSKPLICVATVADILGNRIRIHFDGWADDFDYWTDITSTNIHPVGWCDKNGRSLCPPSGYDNCKGKKPFSWANYLKETNSEPVPEDAFFRRPLREFTNSMAIEVVDIANPSLIRIAKVVDVKGDELKILYDGFDTIYAYWIEDDNPNIHPLGWCLKTNHPIELFKANSILWTCRVPGCNGKGNVNNSKNTHVLAKDCPYEFESWKKLISGLAIKPDRIKPEDYLIPSVPSFLEPVSTVAPKEDKKKGKLKSNKIKICNFKKPTKKFSNRSKMNFKKKVPNGRSKCVYKRAVDAMDELDVIIGVNDYTSYGYGSFKRPRLNVWTRHSVLQGVPIFNTTDVRKWPVREVATFVEIVVSNNYTDDDPSDRIKISKSFINQEIDGDVFLMLTQKDLMDILNIPLGPALKLHNAIVVLRQRTSTLDVVNGLSKLKQK